MIPFSPPHITEEAIAAVTEVLRSGWITTGPKTKNFEKNLSQYCDVPATLCLNSATAGLEIMLRWFGVQEGDEVILPAYTYSATANVIVHCGAKPIFVDVNAADFNISVATIEKAISPRTKVIMPVDFAGWPCDYDEIKALAEKHREQFIPSHPNQQKLGRIMILADAAHSIGASYKGRKTGSLADASVFSFHAVKNLTTAEGGAICLTLPETFDNEEIYRELCVKTLHGQNKDALAKTQVGQWRYDIVEAGYKCNMTDIMAAIGQVELDRYESETLIRRREICDFYTKELSDCSWAIPPIQSNEYKTSSYHLYPLRIRNISESQRDQIIAAISENGVSVNVHFIPIPMMSFYKGLGYDISDYPQTFDNYACEISLPVFYDLTPEQRQTVIETLKKVVTQIIP
ncbi:MAG: DegT/DnrJ/EryC1/StrS aminotransferase family protein [Bacteroidetes bacterium]|nr:MAG: DegT/DnrJ/EryC1/StrS aminotransferase family protein [Bacteroidota bacterium]